MLAQTKKQKEAIELAIHIVQYEPHTLKTREWENLFEDGYNNRNAVLIGLMEAIDNMPGFYEDVLENYKYMPPLVLSYAKYRAGESEQEDKQEKMLDIIAELEAATDKIVNYEQPYDTMTNEKWERLYRYNIEPLFEVIA